MRRMHCFKFNNLLQSCLCTCSVNIIRTYKVHMMNKHMPVDDDKKRPKVAKKPRKRKGKYMARSNKLCCSMPSLLLLLLCFLPPLSFLLLMYSFMSKLAALQETSVLYYRPCNSIRKGTREKSFEQFILLSVLSKFNF